jgi:exosortase
METATAASLTNTPNKWAMNWLSWLKIATIGGLTGAIYAFIVPDLVWEWWTQEESSYGMLIPPIALYIAYLGKRKTLAAPATESLRGLWLVALGCLVFMVGSLASEFFLARISFVILLAGLVWTFWGFARLRTLAFPFILLATMVPLPGIVYNVIAVPLQLFASTIATNLAQALGVSIYQDGNIIHLANISLGVAEACSGLHSLSAMVVASLLLGFLNDCGIPSRILLLVISVPLAIAVNVLRVTGTAILADYQTEFAMGFYHSFSGWLVFLLGFGLLALIGKLVSRWTQRTA